MNDEFPTIEEVYKPLKIVKEEACRVAFWAGVSGSYLRVGWRFRIDELRRSMEAKPTSGE